VTDAWGVTGAAAGYVELMADDEETVDDERVSSRSELLAEEKAAGSDDPEAQARAILEDSEERLGSRDAAPGTYVEHRTSDEATPPPE
jgi:hypothetical protein